VIERVDLPLPRTPCANVLSLRRARERLSCVSSRSVSSECRRPCGKRYETESGWQQDEVACRMCLELVVDLRGEVMLASY
jgi:hypothetical protein